MYCYGCNDKDKKAMNKLYVVVGENSLGHTQKRDMFFCDECFLDIENKRKLDARRASDNAEAILWMVLSVAVFIILVVILT